MHLAWIVILIVFELQVVDTEPAAGWQVKPSSPNSQQGWHSQTSASGLQSWLQPPLLILQFNPCAPTARPVAATNNLTILMLRFQNVSSKNFNAKS